MVDKNSLNMAVQTIQAQMAEKASDLEKANKDLSEALNGYYQSDSNSEDEHKSFEWMKQIVFKIQTDYAELINLKTQKDIYQRIKEII